MSTQDPSLSVLEEFPRKRLLDVSRDGKLLLMWVVSQPVQIFRIPSRGRGAEKQPTWNQLILVERTTSKALAKTDLKGFPRDAYLLPDSSGALFQDSGRDYGLDRMIWNFATNQVDGFCHAQPILHGGDLQPLADGSVVGYSYNLAGRKSTLVRASRESCVALRTAAVDDEDAQARMGDIEISPSEDLLAYVVTAKRNSRPQYVKEILVRATDDLSIRQRLQPPADWHFMELTFSVDSKLILASAVHYLGRPSFGHKTEVLVYEITSGKLLRRLQVNNGNGRIALSPDLKLLAVASKATRGEAPRHVQAQVSIYDFQSGKQVASGSYSWVKEPRDNPWVGDIQRMVFSPDGRELLTTTYDTRIWRVPEYHQ